MFRTEPPRPVQAPEIGEDPRQWFRAPWALRFQKLASDEPCPQNATVYERKRAFQQAARPRLKGRIEKSCTGSPRQRDDRDHGKALVFNDLRVAHDDAWTVPFLLMPACGLEIHPDHGSARKPYRFPWVHPCPFVQWISLPFLGSAMA